MATLSNFKIDGQLINGIRELKETSVSITFDNDSIQANINLPALNFVNKANQALNDWASGPFGTVEGTPFQMSAQDGSNVAVTIEGFIDHSTRIFKSPVESEATIVKTNGLNGFFTRSQNITMLSLETSGLMPRSLGVNIPYLTESRDSRLAKLQLASTVFITLKSGADEIHKILNIASDVPTGGAPIAILNAALTVANIIALMANLKNQLQELQKVLLPLVSYHRGIKLITFLEKGCEKMGYTLDVGTGDFAEVLNKVALLPHKDEDEGGLPIGFIPSIQLEFFQSQLSGILKPNDFGYVLSDAFELAHREFLTKVAIIGNTVKMLPFNDPFWTLNPQYTMPDALIEDSVFTQNGKETTNQNEELKGRTLIEYIIDDSDMWTNSEENVNNSISETIVEPINISNEKNVVIKGLDKVNIPYTLCVRKNAVDDLFDSFQDLLNLNDQTVEVIRDKFETYASVFESSPFADIPFLDAITSREGALKIEHHYFSKPKIVYLENGKIPTNFNDKIGAIALYNNYHSYKSFVPGIKNPNNFDDTNQKQLFTGVTIPFGINDFDLVTNNSYFNTADGKIGKFTSVLWNVDKDKALVDYYILQNYLENIKETTS